MAIAARDADRVVACMMLDVTVSVAIGSVLGSVLGSCSSGARRDVHQLIELNRDALDVSYLRQWSSVLGVDDLLTSALA